MVTVQFTDETPNPANLKVKTPIKKVTIKGNTIEIEFEGEPDQNELQTIATKLRKNKIIRKPRLDKDTKLEQLMH